LSQQCVTLIDAMKSAKLHEECNIPEEPKITINYANKSGSIKQPYKRPSKSFKQYGPKNRFSSNVSNVNNKLVKSKALSKYNKIKCYKCDKIGHIAKNCNVKIVSYVVPEGSDQTTSDLDHNNIPVFICQALREGRHETLLTVNGHLNGNKVSFAIDSGATMSILSYKTAEKLGIEAKESNFKIKMANSIITNAIGITDELEINIQGHYCRLQFLVINHEDNDALLGLDWLVMTEASINPSERSIKFPGKTIFLQSIISIILNQPCWLRSMAMSFARSVWNYFLKPLLKL
jgi:predicted aspartyl protease